MRRSFVNIVLLLLPLFVQAESLFEMGLHGGIAGWSAQPVYINTQIGGNGGAHLYYNFLSSRVIGLRTGLTIDVYNTGLGKTDYEDTYSTLDVDNEQMDISYTIGQLRERQTMWSVGVPLQLAFAKNRFLFLAGAKAVFPLGTKWKQTVEHAALSVYYPKYDNTIYESYPLAASRDFSMSNSGKLTLPKVQWWLSLELNYTFPLNTWARRYRSYILVGAYFDYCFTKYTASSSNNESLIMLTDTRDGFPLQRILTPVMEANRQGRALFKDGTLYDVGIKISYAISPYDPHSQAKRGCHCL
ncbi:MAG: hypothetical protein II588_05745 [Paludibacteraceae bacterium]|nr:hypothetical protein [Paludibacteraceae bacterium]